MSIVRRACSHIRPLLLAGALAAVLSLLGLPAAAAQTEPHLASQITDQTGVLGSNTTKVQGALDDLLNNQNVQLWLVLVPTTGGVAAADEATQIYRANGLGGNDMVLLIAVDDQRYGWYEKTATGLSGSTLDDLLSSNVDPYFSSGDYTGGIVAYIRALGREIDAARAPSSGGSSNSVDTSGLASVLWGLIAVIVIGCGIAVLALWFRAWRNGRLSAEERDKQTGDLARQANKLLVDTDDMLHNAVQEIGFAQAEFDDSDVKPYSDAVGSAQDELKAAFVIRQQLDDSTPEDQPTRAKMLGDIIAHCRAANARVDEQAKRLATLRDLEKTAPTALAALPKAIDALKARLPAVTAAQKALSAYAPSSWATVKGNPEEADKRGHFAETQIAAGKAALAETPPDAAGAAHAARAAQEAVAQANQLLDAIEHLATAMEDARTKLRDEIAAADADVAAAKAAISTAPPNTALGTTAADIARAEATLTTARQGATAAIPDPLAALKAVQDAHATADGALKGIREARVQQQRSAAAYLIAHQAATASIGQARSYLATRSDGVGTQARTRLSEAERHLAQGEAVAATDLDGAVNELTTAHVLADQCSSLAQNDFSAYDRRGGSGGFGTPPAPTVPSPRGPVLGGIFGGMAGTSRGGGFGGTPWGSGGGWTGGGTHAGSGGGFGGFGGGGGGGGGHSGGGGWSGGGGGGGGGGHSGGGGW